MIFLNRQQAGKLLAEKLLAYKKANVIVLGLPRGGVPVAAEIAATLEAPLDVLIVRKLGHPLQPELAVGAVCEDEDPIWNQQILTRSGLEPDDLRGTLKAERKRIQHQIVLFREGRKFPSVTQQTVIVVDDGIATGATVFAAVKFLKKVGAAKVVIAIPVAAASSARRLASQVDEVVVQEIPEDLLSVGQWYEDFTQVSDVEVIEVIKANRKKKVPNKKFCELEIPIGSVKINGDLTTFPSMKALIIFAHGSGSSRKSPRNQMVAGDLNKAGFGTLLFDLLTDEEAKNKGNVFDIELLSQRLISVTQWVRQQSDLKSVQVGYFGASTGAGAALRAASQLSHSSRPFAIVCRGGRPDLAGEVALKAVKTPTLLIVGGRDGDVIEMNRGAKSFLAHSQLSIVPGATHLFEEPGTLEEVSRLSAVWFNDHLHSPTHDRQSIRDSTES